MSGFIDNAKAFCAGFESVVPVGKVTKFVVINAMEFVGDSLLNSMSTPKHDFYGYSMSVDRDAYNQVMNRRECSCE